ncbi:MAG: DUF3307 domain-containing protein [candidate division KSB1 bacterium]|nr:DUF3307 domain-containing protein [candidate division KSB1 bacterium]MDZ7365498.1 DUF3307 domain-containing protein [candidate division KSB1 bacterium]MDZ7403601.1 DUF3307 domain-containing protein [candidate division KSB1 bacterium]
MEQLICHLVGDYVLQTNWMVRHKHEKISVAVVHALTYLLPFVLITRSAPALAIIFVTHTLIDHFRLARHLIRLRNWCWTDNGFPEETPSHIAQAVSIVVDNTLHLLINFLAIRYFG